MSDDFLSRLAEKEDGRRGGGRVELDNPVRASAGARVRTAFPKSRRAGQYVRVSATLLPDTVEELEEVRRQLAVEAERMGIPSGVKMTDVLRMMVVGGLEAWRDGRLEADIEVVAVAPSVSVSAKRGMG